MEIEGAAIRALGSLFKLTEVYIWEDGSTETREICLFPNSTSKSQDCDDTSLNITDLTRDSSDYSEVPEDVELTKQMDALGLPLSFQSNKKTMNKKMNASKRKGTRLKEEDKDEALEFIKVSEVEIVSPATDLHDNTNNSLSCMSMVGQSESYYCDVAVDISDSPCPADEESTSSTKIIPDAISDGTSCDLSNNGQESGFLTLSDNASNDENERGIHSSSLDHPPSPPCQLMDASFDHGEKELGGSLKSEYLDDSSDSHHRKKVGRFCSEISTEQAGVFGIVELSDNSEVLESNGIETHGYSDNLGDWRVYWDTYYLRNYFYNIQTGISTWDPPAGIEHLSFDVVTDASNEAIAEVTENSTASDLLNYFDCMEEHPNNHILVNQPSDEVPMEMDITANSTLPGVTVPENNSFELQDELQRISTRCDDEVTSYLPFDAQGNDDGHGSDRVLLPPASCLMLQSSSSCSFTSMINEQVIEDDNMQMEIGDPATDKLDTQLEPGLAKQKKKARKTLAHKKSSNASEDLQCQEIFQDFSANIGKYWRQRYLLFSRFDNGIIMDEEGWFSVTPEPIARHQALRCASDVIIDCFSGVGGNAIQFAQRCKHVTAIDVDPKKIDYAYHNASIYGVDDQIDFITGDFFVLAPKLKADTVFLSPPWGGPDYAKVKTYNIKTMLKPRDGYYLFNTAKKIARRVVMFLPRNIDFNQLAELILSADHLWSLEVEKNYLNGKLKGITAYYSDTAVED